MRLVRAATLGVLGSSKADDSARVGGAASASCQHLGRRQAAGEQASSTSTRRPRRAGAFACAGTRRLLTALVPVVGVRVRMKKLDAYPNCAVGYELASETVAG